MTPTKSGALAIAAIFLSTTTSAAQTAPPPTPVLPCDGNSIMGSRSTPPRVTVTRTGSAETTEQRHTSLSLTFVNGVTRYFVDGVEVPLARLGQATAEAWLANTPSASIDQCWSSSPQVGEYTLAGRISSLCRIVIRADDVRYREVTSVRNALRDAGFHQMTLMTSDQTTIVRDDHIPLNPVPVRLQGIAPTMVRIISPPDATEPIIEIANGSEWNAAPLADLGANLSRAAAHNNPALSAEELNTQARICVRPDSIIAYGDVLRIITTIRGYGFTRVGLYSQVVVRVDEHGRSAP